MSILKFFRKKAGILFLAASLATSGTLYFKYLQLDGTTEYKKRLRIDSIIEDIKGVHSDVQEMNRWHKDIRENIKNDKYQDVLLSAKWLLDGEKQVSVRINIIKNKLKKLEPELEKLYKGEKNITIQYKDILEKVLKLEDKLDLLIKLTEECIDTIKGLILEEDINATRELVHLKSKSIGRSYYLLKFDIELDKLHKILDEIKKIFEE
ncbi:hypothetical protein J4230_01205 [Candidatus Woesearchaeota archaeon]|nr:hypothetical protein [Candidatus Woesearchaeota archaeon]